MKAIIPEDKINKTENMATSAAQQIYNQGLKNQDAAQKKLREVVEEIQKMNPEFAGMEEVAAMLSLPDESFAILAPIFLSELERSYKEVNNQLEMVQMMNVSAVAVRSSRSVTAVAQWIVLLTDATTKGV